MNKVFFIFVFISKKMNRIDVEFCFILVLKFIYKYILYILVENEIDIFIFLRNVCLMK